MIAYFYWGIVVIIINDQLIVRKTCDGWKIVVKSDELENLNINKERLLILACLSQYPRSYNRMRTAIK